MFFFCGALLSYPPTLRYIFAEPTLVLSSFSSTFFSPRIYPRIFMYFFKEATPNLLKKSPAHRPTSCSFTSEQHYHTTALVAAHILQTYRNNKKSMLYYQFIRKRKTCAHVHLSVAKETNSESVEVGKRALRIVFFFHFSVYFEYFFF